MTQIVYLLCAATSVLCATLLIRSFGRTRPPLLLWTSLCFAGLALNNILLFVDRIVIPATDLSLLRSCVALAALAVLLYGLVWESK